MGKKVDIIYKLQYIVADNSVKIEFFNTDNNASSDICYRIVSLFGVVALFCGVVSSMCLA